VAADRASVPEVLSILIEGGMAGLPAAISVRSLGGAVSRVPGHATAFAHRRAELMIMTTSAGPAPVLAAGHPALDALWRRLTPHVSGLYANFLATATAADVAAIYPAETYERLAAVKRRYDPGNLFAANHNIRPQQD
jgi:FAD/FMN-containing dehydrogenase